MLESLSVDNGKKPKISFTTRSRPKYDNGDGVVYRRTMRASVVRAHGCTNRGIAETICGIVGTICGIVRAHYVVTICGIAEKYWLKRTPVDISPLVK